MPKVPLHTLIWSHEHHLYELYTQGQLKLRFRPAEEAACQAWLCEVVSFAFQGACGRLNVYQEQRPRGGAYWYAYQTKAGRTRKRCLGRTETLTLARLEEIARALLPRSQAAQAPDQGIFVLSSKLAPPRLSDTLVERERLLVALDGALSTKLSLLCAPAGFGKTTLLSAWATQHQAQVAWLTLDELDNSPTRFWVGLIAALRHCGRYAPGFGETAVALLQSPQPPLAAILTTLLHELENHQTQPTLLVLMLDDYQVIEEQAIHESLSFFLEHVPAHLHLLLSSRVDPALSLSRLRVRGQLTEIRADDLRFRLEEANHYLNHLISPTLSAEEVSRLVKRTEGWIAGLLLAALTMQKREDRAAFLQAFTGSQRYLLDYEQEEILARLPTSVRDFLLHTAILSQMSASLCQAVTGASTPAESAQMLALLERANLFLVPLDEERRSYRLHELFREALLSILHTSQPESVQLLHRRAADFYEAQGQWAEAITHRLAATDFSAAARLMEQTVEQFWVRGEAATIAGFVLTLPELVVREHPRLLLTTALYLLNSVKQTTREQCTRIYQQARRLMARVEAALRQERDETDQEILDVGVQVSFCSCFQKNSTGLIFQHLPPQ
jgi:LuxR family maltose regulon positive regulatory protein